MVGVDGLVAVDGDKVLALGCQVTVELCGGNGDGLVLGKASCRWLHNGKNGGKHLVELVLEDVENFLLDIIDFLPQRFALLIVERLDFGFDSVDFVAFILDRLVQVCTDVGGALSQAVDVQCINLGINRFDLVNNGRDLLQVARWLVTKHGFQNVTKSHFLVSCYVFMICFCCPKLF